MRDTALATKGASMSWEVEQIGSCTLYRGDAYTIVPTLQGVHALITDPPYGIRGNYEGFKNESELPTAVYRVDGKTGQMEKVTDDLSGPNSGPNGVCFSPDYKKFYVCDTGGGREIRVYDTDGKSLRNGKRFVQLDIPGTGQPSAADGIRCDVDGNVWAGARPGVQVIAPNGERIGMIRLPETCANICFGGAKRNRLFMAASQSLYSVYVETTGAHIA